MNNINVSIPHLTHQNSSATPPDWSRNRLAELPFVSHKDRTGTYPSLKISGRYWVVQGHFDEVWELFWRSAHQLDPTRKHKTQTLCNDPAWHDRPRGQQIALGRCVRYFAEQGVLPITLANPGKSGPRKYLLHSGLAAAPAC
jgi:hypothetical protein